MRRSGARLPLAEREVCLLFVVWRLFVLRHNGSIMSVITIQVIAFLCSTAGTKTVAAKGKPKKTWATPLAAACGVSERELRYWLRILIACFVVVVIFSLWFGLS